MGGGHTLELWYTLLFMTLILVLSVAQRTRILFENRLIVFIGNISFSFYLIQVPILVAVREQGFSTPETMLISFIIISCIAYLCHIAVEKPALSLTGRQHPYDS